MKKLVMAIIGYGKSAQRYHLPFIQLRENIQVKYICDLTLTSEEIAKLAKKDIIGVTDLSDILMDEEVMLVTLCTPPKTHFSLGKECLSAGKNVIIEKPFCETINETKELIKLAEQQNLLVTPYQNRRFDSDFLTLKHVMERNYVGELIELEAHVDYYRPDDRIRKGTIMDGSFYGLGVHAVDQVISLFGKPKSVRYDLRNVQNSESSVDDYYDVQLFYGRLKVILKSNQVVAKCGPRFKLLGKNGVYEKYGTDQQENDLKLGIMPGTDEFGLDTSNEYGQVIYRNANGDWIRKAIRSIMGDYGRFYDHIFETIIEGKPNIVTEAEIMATMEIMSDALFSS